MRAPLQDIEYVEDLGLITTRPSIRISNRIYQEIIPRELTLGIQIGIANQEQAWYVTPERRLDMQKLLAAFQQFYRENSDIWEDAFLYKESAPQLIMQAFLQRIVNGGGRINREYGAGRRRTDLLIEWPIEVEPNNWVQPRHVRIRGSFRRSLSPAHAARFETHSISTSKAAASLKWYRTLSDLYGVLAAMPSTSSPSSFAIRFAL